MSASDFRLDNYERVSDFVVIPDFGSFWSGSSWLVARLSTEEPGNYLDKGRYNGRLVT